MKEKYHFKKGFLENKNILISGSTSGIGRQLALDLSSYGANIILHGRNENALDALYDEIIKEFGTSPLIIKCDLNDLNENKAQEFANAIIESYECLDGVLNNAAIIGKMSAISDYDYETWQKVLNVNITSSFLLTKYLFPIIEHSVNPIIIFTSSGVAEKGRAYLVAYAISKAAVKSLA